MEVAMHPCMSVHHPSFLVAHTVAKLLVSVKGVCGVSLSLPAGLCEAEMLEPSPNTRADELGK